MPQSRKEDRFQCKSGMRSRLRSSSTRAVSAKWKSLPKKHCRESRDGCNWPIRCSAPTKLIRKQADITDPKMKKAATCIAASVRVTRTCLLLVFVGGLVFVAGLHVSTGAGRSLGLDYA